MAEKKKRKSASLGCLFWIAFILLIITLFFLKRNTIAGVLEKTGVADKIFHTKTITIDGDSTVIPPVKTMEDSPAIIIVPAPKKTEPLIESPATPQKQQEPDTKETPRLLEIPAQSPTPVDSTIATRTSPASAEKPLAKVSEKPAPMRKAPLWLVSIDEDGRVLRKQVQRDIPKSDAPLADSLAALFSGTTPAEGRKGYRSLIPAGTKLISAFVKDGVATLNLNDAFQFNQFGIEGIIGQLAQIVFTATQFPTVTSVQFLIEGQRKEYLGGEGVWIGTPLTRDNF